MLVVIYSSSLSQDRRHERLTNDDKKKKLEKVFEKCLTK